MSLLVIYEIPGLFVNTMTADGKNSVRNKENLLQPINIHLSKKQIVFSECFAAFLISTINFEHFKKRSFCDIVDIEGLGYLDV